MRGHNDPLTAKQLERLNCDIQAGFQVPYLMRVYNLTERNVQILIAKAKGLPIPESGRSRIKLLKIRHPSECEADPPEGLSAKQAALAAPPPKSKPITPNALPWCTKELLTAGRARPARCRKEVAA